MPTAVSQHAGQIGTSDLNKRHCEFGTERILNRHPPVQVVVLTAPANQRVIGTRRITGNQPGRGPVVISTPVEVVDEQPPMRAHQSGDR